MNWTIRHSKLCSFSLVGVPFEAHHITWLLWKRRNYRASLTLSRHIYETSTAVHAVSGKPWKGSAAHLVSQVIISYAGATQRLSPVSKSNNIVRHNNIRPWPVVYFPVVQAHSKHPINSEPACLLHV